MTITYTMLYILFSFEGLFINLKVSPCRRLFRIGAMVSEVI